MFLHCTRGCRNLGASEGLSFQPHVKGREEGISEEQVLSKPQVQGPGSAPSTPSPSFSTPSLFGSNLKHKCAGKILGLSTKNILHSTQPALCLPSSCPLRPPALLVLLFLDRDRFFSPHESLGNNCLHHDPLLLTTPAFLRMELLPYITAERFCASGSVTRSLCFQLPAAVLHFPQLPQLIFHKILFPFSAA